MARNSSSLALLLIQINTDNNNLPSYCSRINFIVILSSTSRSFISFGISGQNFVFTFHDSHAHYKLYEYMPHSRLFILILSGEDYISPELRNLCITVAIKILYCSVGNLYTQKNKQTNHLSKTEQFSLENEGDVIWNSVFSNLSNYFTYLISVIIFNCDYLWRQFDFHILLEIFHFYDASKHI
jgi:hypothetical protein